MGAEERADEAPRIQYNILCLISLEDLFRGEKDTLLTTCS